MKVFTCTYYLVELHINIAAPNMGAVRVCNYF